MEGKRPCSPVVYFMSRFGSLVHILTAKTFMAAAKVELCIAFVVGASHFQFHWLFFKIHSRLPESGNHLPFPGHLIQETHHDSLLAISNLYFQDLTDMLHNKHVLECYKIDIKHNSDL